MISSTSELESDSFASELAMMETNDCPSTVDHLRRVLDIQGEKLNQLTNNNREFIGVQSQLARLRSELEKSEMLRQTLEYELTLLRAQHGKQSAFTQQLQQEHQQRNEQLQQIQTDIKLLQHQKDHLSEEKDKRIKQLESEADLLHERERRIEALNGQIHKMEKSFSDSESISRKNLAQSILGKERENELKKDLQLIEMKLEYSEQALEQERSICNESKLNVQLLTHRLNDLEETCQTFKGKCSAQERKIDELERQCSNEKLLRSTLDKLQSEIETKCSETQQIIIDYEKQLKHNREELANYRRKYRNNEEKSSLLVTKTFELLRLTRIVPETNVSSEKNVVLPLPTLKQLEELKVFVEESRTTKIDQSNEITRLKKTIDRMNKSSINLKQTEQDIELQRDKLQLELEQSKENVRRLEDQMKLSKREKENLSKEIENRSSSLNLVQLRLQKILGKNCNQSSSSTLESDLNLLEKQFNVFQIKCHSLEEKLIERDTGTLLLTQQLEEQVMRLKQDFEEKHHNSLQDKDQLLQRHLADIQNLSLQLQKMETRAQQAEQRWKQQNHSQEDLQEKFARIFSILRYFVSAWIPLRRRYLQLIDANRLLKQDSSRFSQIQRYFPFRPSPKNRFRIAVISILAFRRFSSFPSFVDERILQSFNEQTFINLDPTEINNRLNRLVPTLNKGSLIKLIASALPRSSGAKCYDQIHSLIVRLEQAENRLLEREVEWKNVRDSLKEMEGRVDYGQFERLCGELQRALDREKQAQDLLNEQNQQLKSLSDILQGNEEEKQFLQEKLRRSSEDEKNNEEKISQLTRSHHQMEDNLRRAEKAIRLVGNEKQQISNFCNRIQSALNLIEKSSLEKNLAEFLLQLESVVEVPNEKSPSELILCQTMSRGFVQFFVRLKDLLERNWRDIHSLKEHSRILTDQFHSRERSISSLPEDSTVVVQVHPIRLQVNHHPQSQFKPIKQTLE